MKSPVFVSKKALKRKIKKILESILAEKCVILISDKRKPTGYPEMIRKATEEDLSRIAEISFVFNNRINYFPIFKHMEEYSFGELQAVILGDRSLFPEKGKFWKICITLMNVEL